MSTANLTAADLDAIEARLHAAQGSLKAFGPNAVDVWTQIDDLAALLSAVREARAERDAAYTAADDLEGKFRQLTVAHYELFDALNDAAMAIDPVRFLGTDMIESIPAYLREAGGRIAALERERDEARALVVRLAVDDPTYYPRPDSDTLGCFWWCNGEFDGREYQHAPDCAWQAAALAVAAWKGDE